MEACAFKPFIFVDLNRIEGKTVLKHVIDRGEMNPDGLLEDARGAMLIESIALDKVARITKLSLEQVQREFK